MNSRTAITNRRYALLLVSFICGSALLFLVSWWWGESKISVMAFFRCLLQNDVEAQRIRRIVVNIRLARVLFASLVGAMLAFAGALMQSILCNKLASPYTLGISSSAGFGAALAIISNVSILHGTFSVMGNAFIFSCLSVALIYAIILKAGISKGNIILAGMAINFLFSSANTLLQYFAAPDAAYQVMFWTTGTLSRASYTNIVLLSVVFLASCICISPISRDIGIVMVDEGYAYSIGINVAVVRIISLTVVSILSACTVTVVGVIGFVGLVAPQMARLLGVAEPRRLFPLSACIGSFLLILADLISRKLIQPTVLPIGAITALIGIPFLVSMIVVCGEDM